MIEKKNIDKIAHLARLYVSDDDVPKYQEHFDKIINHFNNLQNINTENVEALLTPHESAQDLRDDIVKNDMTVDDIMKNAPEIKDGLFKVPPVV